MSTRSAWTIQVFRGPTANDEREDDDLYWLRTPLDERARLTWELSAELYALARLNRGVFDEDTGTFVAVDEGPLERRLPRSAFRVTRR